MIKRFFISLVLVFFLVSPAWPQGITHDASTTHLQSTDADSSFSHTVTASGGNRILVCSLSIEGSRTAGNISVTYGGQSLTQEQHYDLAGSTGTLVLLYLVDPPTGANNVAVDLTTDDKHGITCSSYTNVDQTNPFRAGSTTTASGVSTTPSVTVTSATGDLVIDAVYGRDGLSADVSQTQRTTGNGEYVTNSRAVGQSDEAGAASVAMDWTQESSVLWGIIGASLQNDDFVAEKPKSQTIIVQ